MYSLVTQNIYDRPPELSEVNIVGMEEDDFEVQTVTQNIQIVS